MFHHKTATAMLAGLFVLSFPAAAATLSGSPPTTATVGKPYSFTPTLTGANCSDCLRVRNLPAWARFSSATGTLRGTPTAAGVFPNIRIYARLNRRGISLPAFTITVSGATPVSPSLGISGSPSGSVTEGQPYSFIPTVQSSGSTTLSFAVANKPLWALFNSSNGSLSGTPSAGDVATYGNIVISVSNGSTSASLKAFSITVDPAVSGLVTLSWTAPTQNTDGSALTNLAGYRVYYGNNATNLSQQIAIASPATTTAAIENLAPGTWYFAMADYNSAGVESARTATVTQVVN